MIASLTQLGRRSRMRFPVVLPLEYTHNGSRHRGVTRNLSSSGIFIAEAELPLGRRILVSINWPVPFDTGCRLCLRVMGTVVRCEPNGSAIRISKYDFHVRPAGSGAGHLVAGGSIS